MDDVQLELGAVRAVPRWSATAEADDTAGELRHHVDLLRAALQFVQNQVCPASATLPLVCCGPRSRQGRVAVVGRLDVNPHDGVHVGSSSSSHDDARRPSRSNRWSHGPEYCGQHARASTRDVSRVSRAMQ